MNILVGKNSGFCAGVKYTISKANEELEKSPDGLDVLGEIIHNKQVVEDLESRGLRTINSIQDAKNKVIIRAHGTSKEIYDYAQVQGIELIDLTCPNVLKIHNKVKQAVHDNTFIFLLGINGHPETVGTYSFCGENSYIIEALEDISFAIDKLKNSKLKNVLIISQTTFSVSLFNKIVDIIKSSLDNSFSITIEESICNATSLRQKEANEISSKVDLVIIIGGKNSSNTKKLYEVASKNCNNVLHIQTKDDLDLSFVRKFENIGILAGASTPNYIIEDVSNTLKAL